jgi:hypothetical protein
MTKKNGAGKSGAAENEKRNIFFLIDLLERLRETTG